MIRNPINNSIIFDTVRCKSGGPGVSTTWLQHGLCLSDIFCTPYFCPIYFSFFLKQAQAACSCLQTQTPAPRAAANISLPPQRTTIKYSGVLLN